MSDNVVSFAKDTTQKLQGKVAELKRGRKPKWRRTDKEGMPDNVSENVEALLEFMGVTLRRNLMNHSTEWSGELTKTIPTSAMNTVMLANIIDEGQRTGFTKTQHLQAYLDKIEVKHAYHPASEWALSQPWDGQDRVDVALATLGISEQLMAEHGPLLREQLLRWLIAGGKMLIDDRGVAAEGVLVLQGPQGTGKTRWVKSLIGQSANWVAEGVILDPADKDSVILATSTFITELGELDATYRKSDIAALKAFLTRDRDIYRSPYAKKSETYPRRTIFAATVNPSQFLADDTGNRRFWVMPVGQCEMLDSSQCQQLWAQAVALAQAGEHHWLPDWARKDAEKLLDRFRNISPWEDLFLEAYHAAETYSLEGITATRFSQIRDVLRPDRNWTTSDVQSFAKWLRSRFKAATRDGAVAFYVKPRV
jgi:putative DNA primase/helicase